MSYIKSGGNVLACPSLILPFTGGPGPPAAGVNFNFVTAPSSPLANRITGNPLQWRMI